MDIGIFDTSLSETAPPSGVSAPLSALWHAAKGDWHRAHEIVQAEDDDIAAWVHAYLHRVEGDEGNAGYWYQRAHKPHAQNTVEKEWREIVSALL